MLESQTGSGEESGETQGRWLCVAPGPGESPRRSAPCPPTRSGAGPPRRLRTRRGAGEAKRSSQEEQTRCVMSASGGNLLRTHEGLKGVPRRTASHSLRYSAIRSPSARFRTGGRRGMRRTGAAAPSQDVTGAKIVTPHEIRSDENCEAAEELRHKHETAPQIGFASRMSAWRRTCGRKKINRQLGQSWKGERAVSGRRASGGGAPVRRGLSGRRSGSSAAARAASRRWTCPCRS